MTRRQERLVPAAIEGYASETTLDQTSGIWVSMYLLQEGFVPLRFEVRYTADPFLSPRATRAVQLHLEMTAIQQSRGDLATSRAAAALFDVSVQSSVDPG